MAIWLPALFLSACVKGPAVKPDAGPSAVVEDVVHTDGTMTAVQQVATSEALGDSPGVELHLEARPSFPVGGALLSLQLNGVTVSSLSRFPEDGDTRRVIFTLSLSEWAKAPAGAEVSVEVSPGPGRVWRFGVLDKGALR